MGETETNLIAGYVNIVAMLFEIAPSIKAEKAERDSGDVPFSVLFSFLVTSFCFN